MTLTFSPRQWLDRSIEPLSRLRILLLFALIWTASRGLVAASPIKNPGWLAPTAFLALLLAWWLARTQLAGWKAALLAGVIGILWLILTIGRLATPLLALARSLPPLWFDLLTPGNQPDASSSLQALSGLLESLATLFSRLSLWLEGLIAVGFVHDPLVENLLWGASLWIFPAWAGWWLRRRGQVEVGLLPITGLLAYTIYWNDTEKAIVWLVLVAGGWLMVRALETYARRRRTWQQEKMEQVEIEPKWTSAVMILSLVVMLAGGFLPSIPLEDMIEDIRDALRSDEVPSSGKGEAGDSLPYTGGTDTYARLMISAGQELSPDVIMTISVEGYIPPPLAGPRSLEESVEPEVRYYWRSTTYSTYNGRGWTSYINREDQLPPGIALQAEVEPLPATARLVRQTVIRIDTEREAVFTAGEVLSLDQPAVVTWRRSDDLMGVRTEADIYTADSILQIASEQELRQAEGDLPDWIVERYLQLPDDLPGRVYDLAIDLTVSQDNAYDRAAAIEAYLRQFPYTLEVPEPSRGRDAVDFFLFDLQRGYCNYYASAMTVLARAAGLPARMVSGYHTGVYEHASGAFVVRAENAHAWVEIYFSGIGWVEFEPTAGLPRLPRPRGDSPDLASPEGTEPGIQQASLPRLVRRLFSEPLLLSGAIFVLGVVLLSLPWRDWSLHLLSPENALRRIYARLARLGRRWGLPLTPGRTPDEFSTLLAARLPKARLGRAKDHQPGSLHSDLQDLTRLYTRMLYSPNLPTSAERSQAIDQWRRLRQVLRKQ